MHATNSYSGADSDEEEAAGVLYHPFCLVFLGQIKVASKHGSAVPTPHLHAGGPLHKDEASTK